MNGDVNLNSTNVSHDAGHVTQSVSLLTKVRRHWFKKNINSKCVTININEMSTVQVNKMKMYVLLHEHMYPVRSLYYLHISISS